MFILGGPSATSFVYILLISKFWFMFTEEPIEEFVRSGIDLESLEMFLSFWVIFHQKVDPFSK